MSHQTHHTRATTLKRESILHAYALLNQLEIEPAEVDYQAVLLLAEQTRLSVYDTSYLWLAQTLGAELITLDQKLLRVATFFNYQRLGEVSVGWTKLCYVQRGETLLEFVSPTKTDANSGH